MILNTLYLFYLKEAYGAVHHAETKLILRIHRPLEFFGMFRRNFFLVLGRMFCSSGYFETLSLSEQDI